MKDLNHHLRREHRVWHFQIAVPEKLQRQVGKKLVRKSLETGDLRIARQRRDEMLVGVRRAFSELETTDPAPGFSPVILARELRAMVGLGEIDQQGARDRFNDSMWAQVHSTERGPRVDDEAGWLHATDLLEERPGAETLSEALSAHLDAINGR